MNLAPEARRAEDRAVALYHGLADVAADSAGRPPRFPLDPLPGAPPSRPAAHWFRQFIDVRDAEGAERALVSAVRGGASPNQLADMLFAAATDHRYLDGGHTLDFVNKALEALDVAGLGARRGGARVASCSARLRRAHGGGERVAQPGRPPRAARERIRAAAGRARRRARAAGRWDGRDALVDDAAGGRGGADHRGAARRALRDGATEVELASAVTFAAAMRIARFPTSNDFATGTRRCTRSRSRTRSSRGCAARPRPSLCAASSTPRRASTSTAF